LSKHIYKIVVHVEVETAADLDKVRRYFDHHLGSYVQHALDDYEGINSGTVESVHAKRVDAP